MQVMKSFVRNLFGVRKKRRVLPIHEIPTVGGALIKGNIRMRVTEPIGQELLDWLLLAGWRANNFRGDRRNYIELPGTALRSLICSESGEREVVHASLLEVSRQRRDHDGG